MPESPILRKGGLEQREEIVCRQSSLLKDACQRSALQVPAVEWNDDKTGLGWMAKETVRAARVVQIKTCPEERPDNIGGRASGQAGHEFLNRDFDALQIGGSRF